MNQNIRTNDDGTVVITIKSMQELLERRPGLAHLVGAMRDVLNNTTNSLSDDDASLFKAFVAFAIDHGLEVMDSAYEFDVDRQCDHDELVQEQARRAKQAAKAAQAAQAKTTRQLAA